MRVQQTKLVAYLSVCFVVGLCIELFAQPYAIAISRGLDFTAMVAAQVHDDLGDSLALPFKFIPFVGLGLFAAWADCRDGAKAAIVSLLLYVAAFTGTYLYGFFAAERVFKNGYRTAAALNAGLPWLLATLSLAAFPLVSLALRRVLNAR